jgi:hypothetical protein
LLLEKYSEFHSLLCLMNPFGGTLFRTICMICAIKHVAVANRQRMTRNDGTRTGNRRGSKQ